MLAGYMKSKPLGPYFDFVWVHYADWVITTPMLLLDLGMLAGALPPPAAAAAAAATAAASAPHGPALTLPPPRRIVPPRAQAWASPRCSCSTSSTCS